MAPAAEGDGDEDVLEVRCAGCGETLEVERGLMEFICPDCSTEQALPLELIPPPPRRRRALPIPAPARPPPARLPCGSCGALLSVPQGLARCGCPVCGAELAVDPARLRQYLLSAAAAPLVPVSLPPVFQAREIQQEHHDSAMHVRHIRGETNNRLGHVERSRFERRNTQALLEYADLDIERDYEDTEMSNGINAIHSHRSGFSVGVKSVGINRRQAEPLNHVTYQAHAQQSSYSHHTERPGHTIHAGEAQNDCLNHDIHTSAGHIELIKEKTVLRHSNQITGTIVAPKAVNVEKSQVQTSSQVIRQGQKKPYRNIICAKQAAVPSPSQPIDLQDAQINHNNPRDDADVQSNNRINARDSNHRTGCSVIHDAVSAKERNVEAANRVTMQVGNQHDDDMVHEEHAFRDHSDHVIHVEEEELGPISYATYRGEECFQQTNGSGTNHVKRHSGHLNGPKNINVDDRNVEPLKQVMQEVQPYDFVFHRSPVHGNQKTGTGAEPSSSCHKQNWTMTAEKLISQEQEHTPPIDQNQTKHININTRARTPGQTQKMKTKGLIIASNEKLQLRRSKRLTHESDVIFDTEPLNVVLPGQQAASSYQNLSDIPDIDRIIANLCPGSSPQHETPQLRNTESETNHLDTSPASNQYVESHDEIILQDDNPKTRAEVEQEVEHPDNNIETEQDEVQMGQKTVRLTEKRAKRSLVSSSNVGFEHRRSKRLAKQSTSTIYCESPESEFEEHQAASPDQSRSDSLGIDQVSDDISSSSLPHHDMPHRRSNEADNLQETTQSTSSVPDMSDPERFARYYTKIYPPEVRRALERTQMSPNIWLERLINQNPTNYTHAGGKEKKRRGRGPTLCLKVWIMPEGIKLPVILNDLGQPIGNEAATFSSFLGILARDGTLAPLTYANWRRFPVKNKDVMWHVINLKFVIAPISKVWAMKALGKKWKDWKSVLKHERYNAHETEEERLADRDPRVPEKQWRLLVAHWGTEKAKAASARCKASQAQQPVGRPRTGSKSFARIREEERQKQSDKDDPSHTETCITKDGKGKPIDKPSTDVIDAFAKVVRPDTRDSEIRGKTSAKVSLMQALEAKRKAEEEAATLRTKMMEMEENNRKLQEDLANAKSPASFGVNRWMSTDN